jgi:sulfofructose kinase
MDQAARPYIVGFGIACIDYIVVAPSAPAGGRVDASEFCIQGGGLTGTSIVAAARLGARTTLLGRLGDDDIGEAVVSDLNSEGVDTGRLVRVPGARSLVSVVIVDQDTAERTIYSRLDTGIDCPTDLIDLACVRNADVLIMDPHWKEGALLAAAEANAAGVPVVCDANNPVRHKDLLALCDYPIISRTAALRLIESQDVGEALDVLGSLGRRGAAVTCGHDGAYYREGIERGHVPAFEVDAVDTTGAGDVFHGAFAVALAHGWGMRDRVIFASAVSALKCTRIGGRAGIPTFDETLGFLAQRGQQLPPPRR